MSEHRLKEMVATAVESLTQLWLLVRESVSPRTLLVNRFTIVLAILFVATAGANAYMQSNDGNRLTGTVVTPDGTPVSNATVVVRVVGIENVIETKEAVTDADGQFAIEEYSGSGDTGGIELRIRVTTEDGYRAPTHFRHAYFPNQNLGVRLVVDPAAG